MADRSIGNIGAEPDACMPVFQPIGKKLQLLTEFLIRLRVDKIGQFRTANAVVVLRESALTGKIVFYLGGETRGYSCLLIRHEIVFREALLRHGKSKQEKDSGFHIFLDIAFINQYDMRYAKLRRKIHLSLNKC